MSNAWGADVPVSMPRPITDYTDASVPMFGFRFTLNGLMHDLNEDDWERISNPTFRPQSPRSVVRGDADVDGRR